MTVRYLLDPGPSRLTVQAFATGLLSAFGHSPIFAVRDYSGEMLFAPDNPTESNLQMTIRADSLALTIPASPAERTDIEGRMRSEVLDIGHYPEIKYQSRMIATEKISDGWYRLRMQGELSLHGVVRTHPIEGQLRNLGQTLRLDGENQLLLSAFSIRRVSALGGMIRLQDVLKVSFNLMWRQESEP